MLNPTLVRAISADYAGLIALFTRKLGDRVLAEDLINQAFVESLQKLARQQIVDPTRFSGYVYRVAFNLLRNHKRLMDNRTDMRAGSVALESLAADSSPVDQHDRDSIAQQVRRIVEELPVARDREVIRRFYLEEQCKAVICRDLSLSPLLFDKVVFRARSRMKRLMEARGLKSCEFLFPASRERIPRTRPAPAFAQPLEP